MPSLPNTTAKISAGYLFYVCGNMAECDFADLSAECDSRLRSVGKDITQRMSTDKQTPNKSKSSSFSAGTPEIGASYLLRRLDDSCRKLQRF